MSASLTNGSRRRRYSDASLPRPSAVASTERRATAARSPSSGWATAPNDERNLGPLLERRVLLEEGRANKKRMDRRADVVTKSGKRQLLCATAASRSRSSFENEHLHSRPSKRQRARQPVRSRTDHDRIDRAHPSTDESLENPPWLSLGDDVQLLTRLEHRPDESGRTLDGQSRRSSQTPRSSKASSERTPNSSLESDDASSHS